MTAEDRQLMARRLLAVIAIGLVIFAIIWWFFLRESKQSTPVSAPGQGQETSPTQDSGNAQAPTASAPTSEPGSSPHSSASVSSQGQTTQLANAGPGDALAVFGSTVIVTAGIHYAIINRPRKFPN